MNPNWQSDPRMLAGLMLVMLGLAGIMLVMFVLRRRKVKREMRELKTVRKFLRDEINRERDKNEIKKDNYPIFLRWMQEKLRMHA